MGHETQVEVEDIHWFHGYGPKPAAGECDHACEHLGLSVIAWGPSLVHYELVECDDCTCRAWEAALPNSKGGIRGSHPFMKIDRSVDIERVIARSAALRSNPFSLSCFARTATPPEETRDGV